MSGIIITGATRGLGRALSEEFMSLGHRILGCGRSQKIVEEMNHLYGSENSFTPLNITDNEAVKTWSEKIIECFGPPDILINNAAIINQVAPLWNIPAEEFYELMNVNVIGVAHVIRHIVPSMVNAKKGIIINISSGWGRTVDANFAPYCASKWAIEGLTKALAKELPSGMAAIPVNPGIINTDMLKKGFGAEAGNYPTPNAWAKKAAPWILKRSSLDNGKSLDVPQ